MWSGKSLDTDAEDDIRLALPTNERSRSLWIHLQTDFETFL
jgi:hypothetical protein